MNKTQAQAAVEEVLEDLDVHYMAVTKRVQVELLMQRSRLREWLTSGKYRARKAEVPHIQTKTLQHDYGRHISITRKQQAAKVEEVRLREEAEHDQG